ncbi:MULTISPECIES: lyase family protein [unclassified Achromobacter]|uniref:class II fumarate hydratase n=1 Tax=unclassified Achromobacter TaxID=2626865 RepID=UPI000B51669F|nr:MULTISPECIES: class II fumarate hydratase [unclassified Achromobacter]OWT71413.1 class II fumarate hydratase [Achromobacter sp. HZ34]OWT73070.1 class II fumarate hydratase [Achromobacter sp. HZ28]
MSTVKTRIETDAFGAVEIPATRYWGAQTQRALGVFEIGEERFPASLVHVFGLHKLACARANRALGTLDAALAAPVEAAAQEMRDGKWDTHFPLTVWQTGSGTQTNMNANEVIANRANELLGQALGTKTPVHPNDHVNASQSSNDSFPTVMHIASMLTLTGRLQPALRALEAALDGRARKFSQVLKIARTHLMDAVPMTVGQTFATFRQQVANAIARVDGVMPRLLLLPQGGTAAGTGLNAPAGFDASFCAVLAQETGLAFAPNPNKFEGMASHDALVEASGVLNTIAVSLIKIANDLRLLGSGPRCGLAEIQFPDDGLTSSIMPGKRNPTIAEALLQACFQVSGNNQAIMLAGASGNFELNVAKPVLIYNLLQSIRLLSDAVMVFANRFVAGIEINAERLAENVERSLLAVTTLNPILGYDKVATITRKAVAENISPRAAAIALGLLTAQEYDRLVDPRKLAGALQ